MFDDFVGLNDSSLSSGTSVDCGKVFAERSLVDLARLDASEFSLLPFSFSCSSCTVSLLE